MNPDHLNALFELGGAVAVFMSVLRTQKAKSMIGVSGAHVAFFTCWGMWNLFYYPSLDQIWSFAAGVLLTAVNIMFAIQWYKYNRKTDVPPASGYTTKIINPEGLTQADQNRLVELASHFRNINSKFEG